MGDVIDPVLVQADAAHQRDVNLVGCRDRADHIAPVRPQCCATARIGGMLSAGCE